MPARLLRTAGLQARQRWQKRKPITSSKIYRLLAMLVLTLIRFILPGKMWMFILG
nr:MAG TPA: hypothetical protein [Caudoviricetes sp.]